jgi:sodium transport system ATP-binding protein
MSVIEINNISKSFKLSKKQKKLNKTTSDYKEAVKNLSFQINKGEIFGLLGPNGAGKTTTLRILSTLIKPDQGDVLIQGASVLKQPEVVRSHIGFLTSELKLDTFFTPNYIFRYFGALHGLDDDVIESRRKSLFNQFNITSFQEVKISDLSTGMKQKVSLVVSIVHNPDVIIFDEPTNGLDLVTAKTVTDFLLTLKQEGKTIILSTHIFEIVEKLCSRVGIIIDGQLVYLDHVDSNKGSLENIFFTHYEKIRGIQ